VKSKLVHRLLKDKLEKILNTNSLKTLKLNKQVYINANKEYKWYRRAQNDGNYLCLFYEGYDEKKKLKRQFKLLNYLDFIKLKINHWSYLHEHEDYVTDDNNILLSRIMLVDTKLISKVGVSINNYSISDIFNKMYTVIKFNETGAPLIYLRKHIDSGYKDDVEGLQLVANDFDFYVEGYDFIMLADGDIQFLL
jgi:hypothetical protein